MAIEDPNDLERVDLEIQRNELAQEGVEFFVEKDCPPEAESAYHSHIRRYEEAPLVSWLEQLARRGYRPPEPETLPDDELSRELATLLDRLAQIHVYIESTDHLDDRELYSHLLRDSLLEQEPDMGVIEGLDWHIDLVSGGSEEDIRLWLKYYADDQTRRSWAEEFGDGLPERAPRPFDRDRHLPKPSF